MRQGHSTPLIPSSVGAGSSIRTIGVSYLVPDLRNECMPKDFTGPCKVLNFMVDLESATWIESYELAVDMLDVNDAVCAKYFTMMLEGHAHTWLKKLPPNSINKQT